MNVAVLGASAKPERYSNQAVERLLAAGYRVFPVHPALEEVHGVSVCASLGDIDAAVDTVTVYLSPERSAALRDELLALRPRRVIFNPGAENPELADALRGQGIAVLEACTLVLLASGQFDTA
jgi:predicted CoA-binding protein